MRFVRSILLLLGLFCLLSLMMDAVKARKPTLPVDSAYVKKETSKSRDLMDKRLRTVYGADGLPLNRGFAAKGFHRVVGNGKLANGVDTITLNTLVGGGKNDISFLDSSTYHGWAWSLALSNRTKRYSILPLSGLIFVVVSSDTTDTATVSFSVEGE